MASLYDSAVVFHWCWDPCSDEDVASGGEVVEQRCSKILMITVAWIAHEKGFIIHQSVGGTPEGRSLCLGNMYSQAILILKHNT